MPEIHDVIELEISSEAWSEIAAKMLAAGYEDAVAGGMIGMQGIGLIIDPAERIVPRQRRTRVATAIDDEMLAMARKFERGEWTFEDWRRAELEFLQRAREKNIVPRVIAWTAAICILMTLMFPPFQLLYGSPLRPQHLGYAFILTPAKDGHEVGLIIYAQLLVEWLGIVSIAGLAWIGWRTGSHRPRREVSPTGGQQGSAAINEKPKQEEQSDQGHRLQIAVSRTNQPFDLSPTPVRLLAPGNSARFPS